MARRRKPTPPVADPGNIPDAFASGFSVQDWEDWIRLVGWTDDVANGDNGGGDAVRKKSASLVIPRSSLDDLVEALRRSTGHRPEDRKHS